MNPLDLMKNNTSSQFSEIVIRELTSTPYIENVRTNIAKILSLFGQVSNDPIQTFWEEFHENYRQVPDLFPERGIFRGIFAIPIGGKVSDHSLLVRAKTLAIFLKSDWSEEWDFLEGCYRKE